MKKIRVKLLRSPISEKKIHKKTLKALGLSKIGSEREYDARPQIMGMLRKVRHLVMWEEV
ncbi:MAG TPA: 50S ribosomal protein L30 [bacterium (Candidatus Stahlbacteria)]|nr:50S ribosomal protein L30 [Candidatus Stahlbacteria bacterium]